MKDKIEPAVCPRCLGTGVDLIAKDDYNETPCPYCKGTGQRAIPTPDNAPTWKPECPTCQGSGERPITTEDLWITWLRSARQDSDDIIEENEMVEFKKWLRERYGTTEPRIG